MSPARTGWTKSASAAEASRPGSGSARGTTTRSGPPSTLLFVVAGLGTLLLAGFAPFVSLVSGGNIPVADLFGDPTDITGAAWYVGAVNDLTLFTWAAGTAVSLVAALGLRHHGTALAPALAWLGVYTGLLVMDDRFLLHEVVIPANLGVPELATYALYATLLTAILVRYRRVLQEQPEAGLLVLALAALLVWVGVEVANWESPSARAVREGAKLLGAVAWTLFPAALAVRHLDEAART